MLYFRVVGPSAGSLQPLLALKQQHAGHGRAAAAAAAGQPKVRDLIRLDSKSSKHSSGGLPAQADEDMSAERSPRGSEPEAEEGAVLHEQAASDEEDQQRPGSPELHNQLPSR